ncbi:MULTISPECIES: hypothetical protein [unclassified Cellulophaga]|uniref:hypothetical protein n=1 Tax=unclassified Cellulophaga TaxID=2634405 RepID=UPI001F113B3C|nr:MULTISPECIES: hypothetical protein [unclassified Cellulophaga]
MTITLIDWVDLFIRPTYFKILDDSLNYIHYNPMASELVYHERDWKNSSYAIYEEDNPEIPSVKVRPLW